MKNQQVEAYPIIEKTVTLTKDDYYRLMRATTINTAILDSILDLMIKAHTKIEDRKQAMWDGIAKEYFGLDNHLEVERAGKLLEISWATMQINLRSKE